MNKLPPHNILLPQIKLPEHYKQPYPNSYPYTINYLTQTIPAEQLPSHNKMSTQKLHPLNKLL